MNYSIGKYKVVHLIPYDGVGGVETAARSMSDACHEEIQFQVNHIFKNINQKKDLWWTFNPLSLITAAWRCSRKDVDLLIVSLWRSAIVGWLAKQIRPNIKLVAFLHCSEDKHSFDKFATRLVVSTATEIWADSQATIKLRVPGLSANKSRVISFVTRRFEYSPQRKVEPSFIFWGRVTPQKAVGRAIRLFAAIHKNCPAARFWIIGPDGGDLDSLHALCDSLSLHDAVVYLGTKTQDEITGLACQASFYLQTSVYEGMAMSVVESMQMGLVPVVTAVGEIGAYCRDGYNAVLVKSDEQAIEDIEQLLNSDDRYQTLRANAIATWKDFPLYRDSMLSACEELFRHHE